MFCLGLAFQLLHDGLFLFPFLPMGSGSQIHEGNGLTAAGLLFQLCHRRLFCAIVDDTVDHAVIVLHGHLRIFQRIFRQESGDLGKTNTVTVMTGYLTILLDRNDVTDTHRRTVKIRRFLQIKLLI